MSFHESIRWEARFNTVSIFSWRHWRHQQNVIVDVIRRETSPFSGGYVSDVRGTLARSLFSPPGILVYDVRYVMRTYMWIGIVMSLVRWCLFISMIVQFGCLRIDMRTINWNVIKLSFIKLNKLLFSFSINIIYDYSKFDFT